MQQFIKDPDSVLDYKIDWAQWLDTDTIQTSLWVAAAGITVDSDSNDTTSSTVWLSGGTLGSTYDVVNSITTLGGRSDDRTIQIVIVQK